ncbi:MAG: hypothetical protein ACE5HO_16070 [bacterium]
MKNVKSWAIAAGSVLFLNFAPKDNLSIYELVQKLNLYNNRFPTEKVYLQLNKSVFKPGEDIWFKAYVVESTKHLPSFLSTDLTVKLIDENGEDILRERFKIKKGAVNGVLAIPGFLEEGIYVLVAYTNWMQNGSAEDVFSQELFVVNSVLPSFFIHVESNDSFYHPKDHVRARIKMRSREGESIRELEFEFTVRSGTRAFKKGKQETDEKGIAQIEFPLPEDMAQHLITLNIKAKHRMQVESRTIVIPTPYPFVRLEFFPESGALISDIRTDIAFRALDRYGDPFDFEGEVINQREELITTLKSFHDGMGVFSLTPKMRYSYKVRIIKPKGFHQTFDLPKAVQSGIVLSIEDLDRDFITVKAKTNLPGQQKTHWVAQVRGRIYWAADISLRDSIMFKIPTKKFPRGIAQLTVFDNTGVSRAERLVFVNHHKRIVLEISPDKEEYEPKEKVRLTIGTRDENGLPMPLDLCLSIFPEDRLYADATPNIFSTLLLTSDLKGDIVNPNFYFEKSPGVEKALDYLLMVKKLRRFKWEKIIEMDKNKGMAYVSKGAVSGTVFAGGKPVKKARVWFINTEKQVFKTETDEQGKFQAFSDGTTILDVLLIRANTPGGSDKVIIVQDESFAERVNSLFTLSAEQKLLNAVKLDRYKHLEDWADPGAVAKAVLIDEHFSSIGDTVTVFRGERIPQWKKQISTIGVLEATRMVRPFTIIGTKILFRGSSSPDNILGALIVVDGVKMGHDKRELETINPDDVGDIQVYLSVSDIEKFGSFAADGVIEITTKQGKKSEATSEVERKRRIMENPFWIPIIRVDETGESNFNYSNPDTKLSMMGIIEGISADGKLGRSEFRYLIH